MRTAVPIVGLMLTIAVSACAIAPEVRARKDMEDSRNAYVQCVNQKPESPASCDDLKAVFDANMQEYLATGANIIP
jgi:hypothetical protein